MVGMTRSFEDLGKHVSQIERSITGTKVIVTGASDFSSKEEQIQQLQDLFRCELGVETNIIDAYPLGSGPNNPTVINFANQAQKLCVLQNKYLLKGIENNNGQGIFVNDFVPIEVKNKRQKEQKIYKQN